MVIWYLKKIGKMKTLNKWVPHELNADQKNHFEVSTSLISHNNELFLNQIVTCYEKWIFYDNQWRPAQWLNQKEAPKQFLKPKKVMITVCWSAATLVYYSFLYQVKPLGLRSMLSKLMRYTQTERPAASIGQKEGHNSFPWQHLTACHTNNMSKVEGLGYKV